MPHNKRRIRPHRLRSFVSRCSNIANANRSHYRTCPGAWQGPAVLRGFYQGAFALMSTDDLSPADSSSARRLVAAAVSLALGSAASSALAQTSEPQEKQLPKISVESEP